MSRVDLFSLITQFTRSTDTRRSSRAHRGVRGALVPGLVTESRADGLESRKRRVEVDTDLLDEY